LSLRLLTDIKTRRSCFSAVGRRCYRPTTTSQSASAWKQDTCSL